MSAREKNDCSWCPQQAGCKGAYEAMGRSNAPSVVGKVVLAFLVPIGVFIGLVIGLERLLPALGGERIRASIVFLSGFGLTFVSIWLLKQLRHRRPNQQT